MTDTSRRDFLASAALSAVALSLPRSGVEFLETHVPPPRGFADLRRPPNGVFAQTGNAYLTLSLIGDRWSNDGLVVTTLAQPDLLKVHLSSPKVAVRRIHLRWRADLTPIRQLLGDAWERAYGDLQWHSWIPDAVMPWYFATYDGSLTHAYGVCTGAKAFCYWQVDPRGVSLWADVRSGSAPLQLGDRELDVCDVASRVGRANESSFAAMHAFCKQMCPKPRLPSHPLYGSNDWYWAYGKNSAQTVLADAQHIVELSPTGTNRPFAVIDDGWQPQRGAAGNANVGLWDHGNENFGDMQRVAADMRDAGARPGLWIRPLQAPAGAPDTWRLSRDRAFLDPTVPDARQKIVDDVARLTQWGFELIKHDYTTFDLFGRWGYQMGAAMTRDGWTFAGGPTHTTAEVIDDLYRAIRTAAGASLVIGCNTVSHLSAGHFEICRIGDDTSGTEWSRTRKMGVNTLAFRGVQHGAFYVADADCVGVTNAIPWAMNRRWLDLLSRSGTMLFVSLAPDALGADQRRDLESALACAAVPQALGEPLDWQRSAYPSQWRLMGREVAYDWVGADGAGPP
ncbi:MAG: hypothetical protein ABJF01_06050 [bacterium]